MNYYDKEENIIKAIQSTQLEEVCLINESDDVIDFFLSIHNENEYEKWTNNSGKADLPPDFYSEIYGYMMEVMRVDDYVMGVDSPNALESKFIKSAEDMLREKGMPSLNESNKQILYIPDMSKASKNGYSIYVENFRRIVQKHVKKIGNYRKKHPDFKLCFLIFDESASYIQVADKNIDVKPGEAVFGIPHICFTDKNLLDSFWKADVDFVIWMIPNKNYAGNPVKHPLMCVFDMKRKESWEEHIFKYDEEKMMCLEVG